MNRKTFAKCASSAALLLLATGCSTTSKMRVTYDHTERPPLSTYAWGQADKTDTGIAEPRFTSVLQQTVDRVLQGKGYTKQEDGTPSFWVSYKGTLRKQTRKRAWTGQDVTNIEHYTGNDYSSESQPVQYDEGTLLLTCVSSTDPNLRWRATARDEVHLSNPGAEREKHLASAVESILSQFPTR